MIILRRLSVTESYLLNISVIDKGGLTAHTSIIATVEDVNDHAPVFAKSHYEFRITEGSFTNAKIGEVLASDADLGYNSEVVFSLSNDSVPVKINTLDGTVFVNGTLNREQTPHIDLTIIAADGGLEGFDDPDFVPNLSQANLTVYVLDANDNAPKFYNYDRLRRKTKKTQELLGEPVRESINSVLPTYTVIVNQDLAPGSEFARVFANDSDVGLNGMVTFEIMNHKDKFRIDTFTGGLFTVGKLAVADEQDMVYDLSVVASDRGRPALRSMAAVLLKIKGSSTTNEVKRIADAGVAKPLISDDEDTTTTLPAVETTTQKQPLPSSRTFQGEIR